MKRLISYIIAVVFFTSSISVYAVNPVKYFYDEKWNDYPWAPIVLQVNGETIQSDMPPIIFSESAVVPARAVFEKLGAKVNWDETKYQVGVSLDDRNIQLTINDRNATVNGKVYEMPVPSKIINDRTMIPVRFVAETLGLKVEWKDAERIIRIDSPDTGITGITSSIEGPSLRITVSADGPIKEFTQSEYTNPFRAAVDIKGALLKVQNKEFDVKSNYISKIRSAQNSLGPNVTRVVADMSQWTSWKVSLSADRKQLYMDFDNKPAAVTGIAFSKTEGVESLDIDTGSERIPAFNSVSTADKIVVDIPLSSFSGTLKSISADGSIVKSVQPSQPDPNTARLTINTKAKCFVEFKKRDGGIKLEFSPLNAKNITYTPGNYPQITINSERIGFNYFNYKQSTVDGRFVLNLVSSAFGIGNGRMFIGDRSVDYIDFSRNADGSTSDMTVFAKGSFGYSVNTVENSDKLTISTQSPFDSAPSRGGSSDQKAREKVVVIDPGHGGSEYGAIYPLSAKSESEIQVKEKDLNLDIALKLYDMLKKAGVKVYLTRKDDSDVSLEERADIANKLNATLFVSVHNNSGSSWEEGTMALFYPSLYDKSYGITGERVAQIAQEEMLRSLGTTDRGVWKRPRLAVLNATKMPAILAEVAYTSAGADRQKLLTDSFRVKAADALYWSVLRSLDEMGSTSRRTISPVKPQQAGTVRYNSEDYKVRSINGFSIPSKASAKCEYSGNTAEQPSLFDLTIKLNYTAVQTNKTTLEDMRKEARQVLLTKLDTQTVDRIMEVAALQNDSTSHIWEDEIKQAGYTVWVRCLKNSGIASINVINLNK